MLSSEEEAGPEAPKIFLMPAKTLPSPNRVCLLVSEEWFGTVTGADAWSIVKLAGSDSVVRDCVETATCCG